MTPLPKDPEKIERILNASVTVFARKGLEKGTVSDVAREAGIGKGTVYQYFESKDQLFRELLRYFFNNLLAGWNELLASDGEPEEVLRALVSAGFDMAGDLEEPSAAETIPLLMEIMGFAFRDELSGEHRLGFQEVTEELYDTLVPFIMRGQDAGKFRPGEPRLLAFLLFASLDGIGIHYFIHRRTMDIETVKKLCGDLFVSALCIGQKGETHEE